MSKPKPSEVVNALMIKMPDILCDAPSRKGNPIRCNVEHRAYNCPKLRNCKSGGEFVFEKNKGFINAYAHLKSCLGNGGRKNLIRSIFLDYLCQQTVMWTEYYYL